MPVKLTAAVLLLVVVPLVGAGCARAPMGHTCSATDKQFIGITQHDLYHAGQIAILKKALRA